LKVVKDEENVPIDIFGHWDFNFLLLISLYTVYLRKNNEGKHLYKQN
jgi:hypothetical protein